MSTLGRAIAIAAQAHEGQVDKAGAPYILHPLRVMLRMDNEAARTVAVLHDVVEDSAWTLEALAREGFSSTVLAAVEAVTRRDREKYEDFIDRASANVIGRMVKIADLQDNMDMSRIPRPTDEDRARLTKYRQALLRLQGE